MGHGGGPALWGGIALVKYRLLASLPLGARLLSLRALRTDGSSLPPCVCVLPAAGADGGIVPPPAARVGAARAHRQLREQEANERASSTARPAPAQNSTSEDERWQASLARFGLRLTVDADGERGLATARAFGAGDELLRVARKGVVLIEPQDHKERGDKYEEAGNYVYSLSRREMSKLARAANLAAEGAAARRSRFRGDSGCRGRLLAGGAAAVAPPARPWSSILS